MSLAKACGRNGLPADGRPRRLTAADTEPAPEER
jgi:hypothetical protein